MEKVNDKETMRKQSECGLLPGVLTVALYQTTIRGKPICHTTHMKCK